MPELVNVVKVIGREEKSPFLFPLYLYNAKETILKNFDIKKWPNSNTDHRLILEEIFTVVSGCLFRLRENDEGSPEYAIFLDQDLAQELSDKERRALILHYEAVGIVSVTQEIEFNKIICDNIAIQRGASPKDMLKVIHKHNRFVMKTITDVFKISFFEKLYLKFVLLSTYFHKPNRLRRRNLMQIYFDLEYEGEK